MANRQSLDAVVCDSVGFTHASAIFFGWFLVMRIAFHIPDQPFFFAELLETPHHLLHWFART